MNTATQNISCKIWQCKRLEDISPYCKPAAITVSRNQNIGDIWRLHIYIYIYIYIYIPIYYSNILYTCIKYIHKTYMHIYYIYKHTTYTCTHTYTAYIRGSIHTLHTLYIHKHKYIQAYAFIYALSIYIYIYSTYT